MYMYGSYWSVIQKFHGIYVWKLLISDTKVSWNICMEVTDQWYKSFMEYMYGSYWSVIQKFHGIYVWKWLISNTKVFMEYMYGSYWSVIQKFSWNICMEVTDQWYKSFRGVYVYVWKLLISDTKVSWNICMEVTDQWYKSFMEYMYGSYWSVIQKFHGIYVWKLPISDTKVFMVYVISNTNGSWSVCMKVTDQWYKNFHGVYVYV